MKVGLRVPLLTIAAFFLLPNIAAAQDTAVQGNPLHLQQGWSADTIDRWHFISQGTALIPYEWFLALEQPGQTALIRSPENLQKLGFLVEPAGQKNNPDGLAVGLYKLDKLAVNFEDGKHECWKGNWLGLGCAACHTGQVNYHGQQIRIEGGPSHIDIQTFVGQLGYSLGAIAKDPQALASFRKRVKAPAADVENGLMCFAKKVLGPEKEFYSNKDLGKLDPQRVARGKQLYASECADCHDARPAETRSEQGACDEIRIPLFDLDTIGTDPETATTFNKRRISLSKIPRGPDDRGPDDIANYKAAEIATGKITEQWIGRSPANAAAADMVNCGRPNRFRAPLSYRARPLNGIWAMAPYLHNGSVPSLYDLLLPPNQRPRTFYVGNWEFDPQIVGYETKGPFPNAFTYDTWTRGNSNAGHAFGTDLSEENRKALIEYLKTL